MRRKAWPERSERANRRRAVGRRLPACCRASCRQSWPSGHSQTVLPAGYRKHALAEPAVRSGQGNEVASAGWPTRYKTASLRYGMAVPATRCEKMRCSRLSW